MSKIADTGRLIPHIRLSLVRHFGDRGLTIDDPEFPRETEELNRMNSMLVLSIRDLKSARHAANAREQGLWNIPRDKRYGPASSLADQQREIDQLIRDAADIQKQIEDLLKRVVSGNEMEGVHTIAELIEKVAGHESGGAEQVVPDHPAYVPYAPGHFQASPESAAMMAYVAIRALVLIVKKRKNQNRA
jgi:hypothetical protein